MKKVVFLVPDVGDVSTRFRVRQYLPHLERRGIATALHSLHTSPRQRWRSIAAARDADAVVVHRAFLGRVELAFLRRVAPPYVYDFDDAIMFRDSAARRQSSWQRRLRWSRMVRYAGHVVAGNGYLAEQAARYQRRVTVIPTAVDVDQYDGNGEVGRGPIVGWMGTRINLMYLERLATPLARLAARHPEVRVKVVSDGSIVLPGVPLIVKSWTQADEVADLRSFRVGIMPLPDDPWTRGKCGVKILQYLAAGVPVVCSPVGANRDIVAHGQNGYCAASDEEWVARLEELLAGDALRARFAQAGRETIVQRYGVGAMLDRFVEVLADRASS